MEIRPVTEEEKKYTYTNSWQIMGQTGCIGHLRGDFDSSGFGFFTSWEDHCGQWKTDEFKAVLDEVIDGLRSEEGGLLQNCMAMRRYVGKYPESAFNGNDRTEYGFWVDKGEHAFLFRCDPTQGTYNFYCYCYVSEWLDRHMEHARKGIRFIDPYYNELFRIPDGGKIVITFAEGEKDEKICRYIDEYHVEVGRNLYHICEFAEIMARCRTTYEPKEQKPSEKQKPEKQKPDTGLELQTSFGTTEKVQLTVNMYADNNGLFVGLTTEEDGCQEPYCNVTVNLLENVPAYCAFVDTNNMPELEGFLVKNKIAEFTGLTHQSGFCTFPLYSFSPERLRELCPDGTAAYEQTNRIDKKRQKAASR